MKKRTHAGRIKKTPFLKAEKIADTALSQLVRAQRPFCEFHYIFNQFPASLGEPPCKCNGVLQGCHKIERGKKSVRYERRNVFSGCSGSNAWAHFNQLEWDRLWRRMWPEDESKLEMMSKVTVKRSAEDLIQMAAYFDREKEKFVGAFNV